MKEDDEGKCSILAALDTVSHFVKFPQSMYVVLLALIWSLRILMPWFDYGLLIIAADTQCMALPC